MYFFEIYKHCSLCVFHADSAQALLQDQIILMFVEVSKVFFMIHVRLTNLILLTCYNQLYFFLPTSKGVLDVFIVLLLGQHNMSWGIYLEVLLEGPTHGLAP